MTNLHKFRNKFSVWKGPYKYTYVDCPHVKSTTIGLWKKQDQWTLRETWIYYIIYKKRIRCTTFRTSLRSTSLGMRIHGLCQARDRSTVRRLAVVPPWRHHHVAVVNGDSVVSNSNRMRWRIVGDVVTIRRCWTNTQFFTRSLFYNETSRAVTAIRPNIPFFADAESRIDV